MPTSSSSASSSASTSSIMTGTSGWIQKQITVKAPHRGFHLITEDIINQTPELSRFVCGTANIFIKHTSASLTINENADPDVRTDMESAFNRIVPEVSIALLYYFLITNLLVFIFLL